MTNSSNSPRSSFIEITSVALLLTLVVTAAAWYFNNAGYLLYWGDAQAHLNISRSLIDSRTPGYEQIGTVWLPVLHIICLPLIGNTTLWHTGLAATLPVAACFLVAGICLYLCAKDSYKTSFAALVALLAFALNPNVLYLSTICMTEIVFIAGLAVCLLAVVYFRRTQRLRYIALAIIASWWMSLTRYDGWYLIPFIALFLAFVAQNHKFGVLIASGTASSLAPIYWFAHNWWETSNPLNFYNGPYSAIAIQGDKTYPGLHDWPAAIHYYFEAARLCCGNGLLILGMAGLALAIWQRRWQTMAFLSMTPLFYVWSIHSSRNPIFVPTLWPHGYYNTRYAIAVVVLMAFAMGNLASAIPQRHRRLALLLPLLTLAPWLNKDNWICWKESQRNSDARRAWTAQAATYLHVHYKSGDGILTEFGDLTGVFCKASIPLKEAIHEGTGPAWLLNTASNGLSQTKWAMAQDGGYLSTFLKRRGTFQIVKVIQVEGAPKLFIYERN